MSAGKTHLHFEIIPTTFKNSHDSKKPLTIHVTKITGPADAPFPFVAYAYLCHLNEDFDGAPRAYAPPASATNLAKTNGSLDYIGNATSDSNPIFDPNGNNTWHWAGVLAKRQNEAPGLLLDNGPGRLFLRDSNQRFPVLHQPGTANQGFYVSTNGVGMEAYNPARPTAPREWDQDKYLDASDVPYCVYAEQWAGLGVGKGDYGLAIRPQNGAYTGFVFGDSGTPNKVGECSTKLFRTLSASGYNEDQVLFMVFPGSGFTEPVPALIRPRVKFEIMKLNTVPNVQKIADKYSSSNAPNIMSALAAFGYHNMLIDL